MEEIALSIDGKRISCRPGISILDAARENGIKIPTLCHHPHLEPAGACRLCLVQDAANGRIMASCVTPVSPEMSIETDSETIRRHRTNIIRLMMANHPESCIVCNQGNRCELRLIAAELGVGAIGLYPMPHYTGLEEANPFIIRDLSKCILCGKCIRADHELVVVGAIDYNLRGFRSRPATAHEQPLENSTCTFCGTCVSMCPTGALVAKNTRYVGTPQKTSETICGFCAVGCALVMGSVDGQVVDVVPSHEAGTVNRSTLCVRGHFAHDYLNAPQRLTSPGIRREGELVPAQWEEALGLVAERLTDIKRKYGPQSVGFIGSTKCTNEENYLFQKIARAMVGTNNVDNGSYLTGRPTLDRVRERLDGVGRVMPLSSLEQAEVIFVLGADPMHSTPVAGYYLKRASRMKGIPLIVADPRKTELVPFASLWLPLHPHTDLELINALASILHERGAYDAHFLERYTKGFEEYRQGLKSVDRDRALRITGLEKERLEGAADLLRGRGATFVVGQGILKQRYGAETLHALLNLALMRGDLGGEGGGLIFLSLENNQTGACHMGTTPDSLPGRQPIGNPSHRRFWERAWGVKLSPDPGLNLVRMVEEAEKGNLKALYVMGENPLRGLPGPERVRRAFEALEFLVVQDILSNETTALAHVVLPGAAPSEKSGTFTNMEGRVQAFEPAAAPPGEAKADWEILAQVAKRLGDSEVYSSPQRIVGEIRRNVPMYASLDEQASQCWIKEAPPAGALDPEEEGALHRFAPLVRIEEETSNRDYPFRALFGPKRFHLGSGTRTGLSDRIRDFALKGEVEISPQDADRLGLAQGDQVRISSEQGAITREVLLKRDMRPGLLFIPTAFHGNDARRLIGLTPLGEESSPGWQESAVKMEKI